MIASFRHKGLRLMFQTGRARYVRADLRERVVDILAVLHASATPADADLPGFRLHQLRGKDRGVWSITVSGNWRITLRFANGNAEDVDLLDYH